MTFQHPNPDPESIAEGLADTFAEVARELGMTDADAAAAIRALAGGKTGDVAIDTMLAAAERLDERDRGRQ